MTDLTTPKIDRVAEAFDEAMQIGLIAVGIGGVLLLWQLYRYTRSGIWPSISVTDALAWAGNEWARGPADWLGLHQVFSLLPASLMIGALGVVAACLWYRMRVALLR